MIRELIISFALWGSSAGASEQAIRLYPGFVTKVRCTGRLLVSAVGNTAAVRLEPLPKELGCGVLLKPTGPVGTSNLILETSAGTIRRLVEVRPGGRAPISEELEYRFKGDAK